MSESEGSIETSIGELVRIARAVAPVAGPRGFEVSVTVAIPDGKGWRSIRRTARVMAADEAGGAAGAGCPDAGGSGHG